MELAGPLAKGQLKQADRLARALRCVVSEEGTTVRGHGEPAEEELTLRSTSSSRIIRERGMADENRHGQTATATPGPAT